MSVSRAGAWQVAVAWVVDAPMDRSMTVTRAATAEPGSDAEDRRLAMVGLRWRCLRQWRTPLGPWFPPR